MRSNLHPLEAEFRRARFVTPNISAITRLAFVAAPSLLVSFSLKLVCDSYVAVKFSISLERERERFKRNLLVDLL